MRQYTKIGIILYALFDYIAAVLAWALFFGFRKTYIEQNSFSFSIFNDPNFFKGVAIIPFLWLIAYFLLGTYTDIYKKSRLAELNRTLLTTFLGVTLIFFVVILDDVILSYTNYYQSYLSLLGLHFLFTFLGRFILLNRAKKQLKSGKVAYRTLIVGGNKKAYKLYNEIVFKRNSFGHNFIGFITLTDQKNTRQLEKYIPKLGKAEELRKVCNQYKIDEVILALESSDHPHLNRVINTLADQTEIVIKVIPDMYDILSGSVRMNHLSGAVLIEIYPYLMPEWQKKIKRLMDVVASAVVILLLSPLYLYTALRVKMSSKGPIFYKQERIGKDGKPFNIIKFRSMFTDAEKHGPALSSDHDPRITKWGRVMRKWRLDEIPQFYNVLRGDMSLVGPRPERQFYIDQLTEIAPEYRHLHKVKPGITSWGMVQFGYAENLKEMVERLKYDLLYIENMSLATDFKVMIYTLLILFQGKGK